MLSHPGRGATSMSFSSISSRVKVTSMMAGDKNCNFTLCKTSQIGTFHRVIHDVGSFSEQTKNQNKPSSLRSMDWKSTLRPPSPSEFPMTLCGGGMDIFWNHTIFQSTHITMSLVLVLT